MARFNQYVCDGCGREDRPVQVVIAGEVVPLPDEWTLHSIDGDAVHLCPDCSEQFRDWLHSFFECDLI